MVLFVGGFLNAKQVLSFRALSEICAKFALFSFLSGCLLLLYLKR